MKKAQKALAKNGKEFIKDLADKGFNKEERFSGLKKYLNKEGNLIFTTIERFGWLF